MAKYLLKKGANVNGENTNGRAVLHSAVAKGALDIVKYLVENGADVNSTDIDGRSVLHSAVTERKLDMIKYLVEHGANVNGKDSDGETVLHFAVSEGTLEMVKYILEHGADINCKDADGWTALHASVDTGALEIVEYLVEQGADIALESKISAHTLGTDIMRMAVVNNSVALVNLLLQRKIVVWRAGKLLVEGRQMNLLEWSIFLGHDEIPTILKRSVKHREKIQVLKTTNCNQLEKMEIPMQAFLAKSQFKIGDGCGGSRVYVGLMKDGSEVAVKRILVQSEDKTVENEKEIMSLIETENCPFIVSYRYFHSDDDFMYLIVDLCEENLRELVHACSIKHLQEHGPRMIREILSGLEFLHGKGVLHRDLKPSNVLVDIEGRMKLADFGISRVLEDDQTTVQTFVRGTPGWMPSEVTQAIEKNEKCRFKRKSDVQVAGMIAFYVLTKGEHPFGSSFDRMRNISEGNSVSLKKLGDRKAQNFVSWLINHKIDERPYAHEALRDPFVDEH
ncbi:ankyrin repeat domain-containing protein 50-like [Dendronephthya gigantea]|uniref:ankyrin repeat domain-containing protein 50-like n=1 Tax=Dendronephthya gigantea TaxID=151771 RepID=UPI00106BAD8A|nr:ankyrin repeat domain-containing protein 50-like [Dendronephthya gigantea]